jgi:hypothetical protein
MTNDSVAEKITKNGEEGRSAEGLGVEERGSKTGCNCVRMVGA